MTRESHRAGQFEMEVNETSVWFADTANHTQIRITHDRFQEFLENDDELVQTGQLEFKTNELAVWVTDTNTMKSIRMPHEDFEDLVENYDH